MVWPPVLLATLLGLIVGSFLNVVVARVPKDQPLTGRSRCPHCRQTLGVSDLVPLVSFVLLRGRCRFCQKAIAWRYPLVELACGFLFALAALRFGVSWSALWLVVVGSFALALFVIDLERQVVPDQLSLPAALLGGGLAFLTGRAFTNLALGAIVGAAFFALQYVISRGRWVGDGDIRLGVLVGASLGLRDLIVAVVLAYVAGALVALGLLVARRARLSSRLPFGAFLMPALVVAFVAGGPIATWYLDGGPYVALGLDRVADWFLIRHYGL